MTSAEPGVPDGIKVDREGRIFCTGPEGIWITDGQGNRIGVIRFPEVPRNMAFGGEDSRTLYVTGGHSLYSVRVKTPGIGAF
jgi:gluconolactonase